MILITPFGRYDRASVIGRAKELCSDGAPWKEALSQAYREASTQLRAYYSHRASKIAIKREDAHA